MKRKMSPNRGKIAQEIARRMSQEKHQRPISRSSDY